MKKIATALFIIGLSCCAAFAQSKTAVPLSSPAAAANANSSPSVMRVPPPVSDGYIIAPEDVLTVTVWKEPDLSVKVTVRSDGMIGLPLLNDVLAAGMTTSQL